MAQMFGLARIGRDAVLRTLPSGEHVTDLSLAFSYGRRDTDGKRPTQWADGSLWGNLAKALAPYLLKGTTVSVTLDDVHIEEFKNRDGGSGFKLAGRVSLIELAGGGQRQATPAPAPQKQKPEEKSGTGFDEMDTEIPF